MIGNGGLQGWDRTSPFTYQELYKKTPGSIQFVVKTIS